MKKTLILILLTGIAFNSFTQNYSLDFDGTDDYVNLGKEFDYDISDPFTVECWLKTSSTSLQQVVSKLDQDYKGWGIQLYDGFLDPYMIASFSGSDNMWATGTTFIADGNWHHIAVVFDGYANISCFIDGIPETVVVDGAVTGSILNLGNINIGSYDANGNPGEFFDGQIDDLRIWDTDLSQGLISASYSTELTGGEADLVAYYKFDDTLSPCDVMDCSPSIIHGTRFGSSGSYNLPQYNADIPSISDQACINNCSNVDVNELESTSIIKVYPNPNKGKFNISFPNVKSKNYTINVYNLMGKLVFNQSVNSIEIQKVDLRMLPNGIYTVEVTTGEYSESEKLVID